jgi:hypothetical protein
MNFKSTKNSLIEKERTRIALSSQEHKDFIGRNAILFYFLTWGLYPTAALYSAFTAGAALYVYINSTVGNIWAAMGITITIALVVELAKHFFGNAVSDDLRNGVFAEGREYKRAFILKVITALGVFAISITLSLTGAPDVSKEYRQSQQPVSERLVDLDAIEKRYDQRVAAERSDIEKASEMTWKGVIVRDGRKIIDQAKQNIALIEAQRKETLEEARSKNNEIISNYDAETEKSGMWFTGFAGAGELVAIIILLFAGNYRSGAEKELQPAATAAATAGTNHSVNTGEFTFDQLQQIIQAVNGSRYNGEPNQPPQQPPVQPRRIGFEIPSPTPDNPTAQGIGRGTMKTGQCLNCGGPYPQTTYNRKYCSEECKLDFHAKRHGGRRFNPNKR